MFEREVALYRRLQGRGVQVTFVTYGDASEFGYASRIPGIRILCNRWGIPRQLYERWLPWLHMPWLRRADIFKTNQTNGAEVALRAAQLWRKPLVARCGYMWSLFAARKEGADSEAARYVRAQETKVFNAADRVVVTADDMKQYVMEQYGIADGQVRVVPNYVLTDLFRPEPENGYHPARLCFVGRLEPQKNLFALLESLRGLEIELEIIGTGPQRGALEAAAREKGVKAHFLGNRPHSELPQHFNKAAIVVLPSLYEGHPKSLLEAMACGRPVIGADSPGIREVIRHGETAWLCGTDPASIREAIRELLARPGLRNQLGQNARQFVVENFAIDRIVDLELSLLRELVRA